MGRNREAVGSLDVVDPSISCDEQFNRPEACRIQRDKPLVAAFDLVTSVGGVQKVMAILLPRLTERFRVAVLDPYDHPDYPRLLSGSAIDHVTFGSAPRRRFIGGNGRIERVKNLAERAPWLISTGLRLRQWVRSHRPAVVYFNMLPTLSFFSRFLPGSGPRIVYHAHGFASAGDIRNGPHIGQRCARILTVSRSVAALMIQAGVDQSKISVVYNGIDAEDVRQTAQHGSAPLPDRSPGEIVLAHVAVLGSHKQQHLSIEVVAQLPSHVVLWLCGSVPDGGDRSYLDRLRKQARALGVEERVKFLGWRDDVPFVLAAADLVILPSGSESFGMVLAEAMALGKPCIGSATGGIPEVIEHGVTGWVVKTDPGAFVAVLAKLVASPEARRAMGEAGRRRVERLFTADRQASQIGEVLEAVAKEVPTP